jgi:hypothetical protein
MDSTFSSLPQLLFCECYERQCTICQGWGEGNQTEINNTDEINLDTLSLDSFHFSSIGDEINEINEINEMNEINESQQRIPNRKKSMSCVN